MVNFQVELAVLQNRLARAAQHLFRASEELQAIEAKLVELSKDVPGVSYGG